MEKDKWARCNEYCATDDGMFNVMTAYFLYIVL